MQNSTSSNNLDFIMNLTTPEISLSQTPYQKPCIFSQNFLPPKNVAIRISNSNDSTLDFSNQTYSTLLNKEFPVLSSIEYSCTDRLKQFQGVKNTICLENGDWSEVPHNNQLRIYCLNEQHEAVRQKVAHWISVVSILVIFSVISAFCCACLIKRARRKSKIRAAQLARQNQVMFDNQAYLDGSSRFQEVRRS